MTLTLSRISTAPPTDPPLCNVLLTVRNQYGRPVNRAKVTASLIQDDVFTNDGLFVTQDISEMTDSDGRVILPLIRGPAVINGTGAYAIVVETAKSRSEFEYVAPDAGSDELVVSS